MKYAFRIYPAAEADVDDAALFIARDNFDAALRFYDAVSRAYDQIREHPLRWPRYVISHPKLSNLRKRSIPEFRRYLVFYQVDANFVDVIRVLHGARDIRSELADGRI